MNSSDLDRIATGFIAYRDLLAREAPYDDPAMVSAEAAYDDLHRMTHDGSARDAWEVVLELLRRAPDEELDYYAAGPLEDLVQRRGEELVSEIEELAARDERFRWALGCTWLSVGALSAATLARIVKASDGEISKSYPLADPHSAC